MNKSPSAVSITSRHILYYGAALSLLLAGAGCKGDSASAHKSAEPETTRTPAEASEPTEKRKPSARTLLEPWRPLLEEARRAELSSGGLFVDLGTADQHKYTRGGWRTGWGTNQEVDGVTVNAVSSRKVQLDVVTDGEVAEIAFRARSQVAGQVASIYIDDEYVGDQDIGADWGVQRLTLKKGAMEPGRHILAIRLNKGGDPGAEFDWLWLPTEADAEPPVAGMRVLPLRLGKQPRRALIAPEPRSYSFYMQPPDSASLVFDYGSDVGAQFVVRVHSDGAEPEELFSAEGTKTWTEAKVDLADFAGRAIRLELEITGDEGKSGWGEPVIMVEPDGAAQEARAEAKIDRSKRPKNLLVILIDTVRADVFNTINPDSEVHTPAYDRFAERSTVFVNAYNNENWTKPSVATTLSGLYPSTHDTKHDASKLPDEVELISEYMKAKGFATAGFVANGYVSNKFGFEQGWDTFRNYIRENRKSDAEYVYRDALAWLTDKRDADKPFFLYIQTIDPHVIYSVPRDYSKRYFSSEYGGPLGPNVDAEELAGLSSGKLKGTARDIDWVRAVYRGEVSYHDEHMGLFLDELDKLGLTEDTLIVITNDHGEEHDDHGKFGHGHSLYEELLRAPLLMHYSPRFPAGERITEVVENVDVVPTILEVMGLEPMKGVEGQSLLPLVEGKPIQRPTYAVTEFLDGRRSVRVGNWKLMRSSSTWIHLFDVAADPGEQKDRVDDSPIARRMCEVYLGEGLAMPDKSKRLQDMAARRKLTAGKADISPELRRQLEALGYFGDNSGQDVAEEK